MRCSAVVAGTIVPIVHYTCYILSSLNNQFHQIAQIGECKATNKEADLAKNIFKLEL